MKTDTIVCCVVALLLGMLLANMLKNVCGCKLTEGQCSGPYTGMNVLQQMADGPDGNPSACRTCLGDNSEQWETNWSTNCGGNPSRVPAPAAPASQSTACVGVDESTPWKDWPAGCMDCFREGLNSQEGMKDFLQAMNDCGANVG